MVQKAGELGRLQVTRLQIYYGVAQAETTLFSFEELQSFDLPMIFQIKRPVGRMETEVQALALRRR